MDIRKLTISFHQVAAAENVVILVNRIANTTCYR